MRIIYNKHIDFIIDFSGKISESIIGLGLLVFFFLIRRRRGGEDERGGGGIGG